MEPHVYRLPAADRIAPCILPGAGGVLFLLLGSELHWTLPYLLIFGAIEVFFVFVATIPFRLVSVASDEGVQPSGRKSRVVPWEGIDSFAVARQKGRNGRPVVLLVPADGSRPVELKGTAGKLAGTDGPFDLAEAIAGQLNGFLRARRAG